MKTPEFIRNRIARTVAALAAIALAVPLSGCDLLPDKKEKWSELSPETEPLKLKSGQTFWQKAKEICPGLDGNEQVEAGSALIHVNNITNSLVIQANVDYEVPVNFCDVLDKK